MRFLALLLTFSLILAGCAGDAPTETESKIPVKDVQTGPDVGAISGVVIDGTYTPVAGALVTLKASGLDATTDGDGTFVFEDLAAGVYFLDATADGFLPIQQQATVIAGQAAEAIIQLPADDSPVPYHQTITFSGHMVASDIYVVYLLTYYLGNTTLCECIFTFTPEPGYETAILQGDWTPNIDPTEDHALYWEIWAGSDEEGHTATYLGPMETLVTPGAAFGASDGELWVQVSSSEIPDVEQPFDGYLTLFYVEGAPAGWSFGD